MMLMMMF